MVVDEDVYLEHHGVRGMQWGKHKARNNSSVETSPRLSKKTKRNIAIGGAGAAILIGGAFAARYMSSSRGRLPINEAASIVRQRPYAGKNGHAREAAFIREGMNRMYSEIASDFRKAERNLDPRFISDISNFRWPSTFDG